MKSIKQIYLHVFFIWCVIGVCQAVGEPNNGSFELFDYNAPKTLEYSDRQYYNFPVYDPNGWHTENFVTVVNGFLPNLFAGVKSSWLIPLDVNFPAFKGEHLLVLSSGDTTITSSTAWQPISIAAGDKLTGVYFVGVCDYLSWDDWAEIKLVPLEHNSGLPVIILASADVETVGDYSSFTGWTKFEYTFSPQEAGDYNLILFVSDKDDKQLESYLLVDSIVLCKYNEQNPPPEKGDFNCDCTVDFQDFNRLARDWLYDCSSLSYDPNCSCLLGTDIDDSGPVDFNDLRIFSENWLCGIKVVDEQ